MWKTRVQSWVRKILWRRKWQPTPALLPGKSHGQRSMVGCYSPWDRKESDTTEWLHSLTQATKEVLPIFLKQSLVFPILLVSSISLHCSFKKAFYLSLLFSGTQHSVGLIFLFLSCFSLLFFLHLFIRLSRTTALSSCISLPWDGFGHCLLYKLLFRHSV